MRRRARRVRWTLVVGGVLLLAFLSVLGLWLAGALSKQNPSPEAVVTPRPFAENLLSRQPITLAPRIHMLGRLFPSVAYVVETSDGLVLVDSGLEPDAQSMREQLGELGLDISRLRAILLTHAHGDHTLGARYLRELTGAKVYAGQGDSEVLRAGGPREAFFSTFAMDRYSVHATPVDVELTGGEVLEWGDTQIKAVATPGHTPGSTCYLLQRGDLRVLFTGDTVSSLVIGIGTYSAHLAPRYRSNARDYMQSLQRLRAMSVPDLVLPGHPAAGGTPHSPRLTQSQWEDVLDRGIADLDLALDRYTRDGADFLDGLPKELLPGLWYLGDYADRAVYVLVAPEGHLLFDSPGDNGFAAFFRESMKKTGIESGALKAVVLTSCAPDALGGLRALVEETGCEIVVPDVGRDAVAAVCPQGTKFTSAQDFFAAQSLDIQVYTLAGRGVSPMAYLLAWKDKSVLVSGQIPIMLSEQSVAELQEAIRSPSGDPVGLARSLDELRSMNPDLWLPSQPIHGQNANLYAGDWQKVLEQNQSLIDN